MICLAKWCLDCSCVLVRKIPGGVKTMTTAHFLLAGDCRRCVHQQPLRSRTLNQSLTCWSSASTGLLLCPLYRSSQVPFKKCYTCLDHDNGESSPFGTEDVPWVRWDGESRSLNTFSFPAGQPLAPAFWL